MRCGDYRSRYNYVFLWSPIDCFFFVSRLALQPVHCCREGGGRRRGLRGEGGKGGGHCQGYWVSSCVVFICFSRFFNSGSSGQDNDMIRSLVESSWSFRVFYHVYVGCNFAFMVVHAASRS